MFTAFLDCTRQECITHRDDHNRWLTCLMLMTFPSCSSSSSGMGNGLNRIPFTSGVISRTEVSSELQLTLLENFLALTVVSVLQFRAAWTEGGGLLFISCV